MSNLIITIISIAFVAVAAAMAIFYGGQAFQNMQPQAWANAMMSQNQQLIAAANDWSLNHGGDIWSDVSISDLVNQGYLSQWPNLVFDPPAPAYGTISTGVDDNSCTQGQGYQGWLSRSLCTANGQNIVNFYIKLNDPFTGICAGSNSGYGYGFEDARYANHPMVQLALAVNKITKAVPATATIAGSGLPYAPAGASWPSICSVKSGYQTFHVTEDSGGNLLLNYCVMGATPGATQVQTMTCSFTQ